LARKEPERRPDAAEPAGETRLRRSGGKSRGRPGVGALLLVCLAAVMLAAGGTLAYRALSSGPEGGGPVTVSVEPGDSLSSVSRKLKDSGAVGSATVFELQARIEGAGTEIKPGEYRIPPGDSNREILTALTEGGEESTVRVSLPEGLTLEQTAERVAAQGGVSEAEFRRAAGRTDYGYGFLEGENVESTEGFLFPKQYEFPEGTAAPRMVGRMLEQYVIETRGLELEGSGGGLDLSERQIVTVASLIEREAAGDEERAVIASVIYNRLREGMPLQIDATVQYALGESKEALSFEDLEVESPYNTYEREGLPPGPIASPGLASIRAALNPADTGYRYYVLDRDGESHTFTESYQEFLGAKERAGR